MKHNAYQSLLWPDECRSSFKLDLKTIEDLDFSNVFGHHNDILTEWLRETLHHVPTDKGVVQYRQAIVRDFDANSRLLTTFTEVAAKFKETKNMIKFAFERDHTLYNVLKRVEDSEVILEGLYSLNRIMKEATLNSDGLRAFRGTVRELMDSELFLAYEADLKRIRSKGNIKSMKLGLNLDEDMNPKEAIVLTLEEEFFRYSRPLKRMVKIADYGYTWIKGLPRRVFAPETVIPKENLNALEKIISPAMGQLLKFIDIFNEALLDVFAPLSDELSYYNFALSMKRVLAAQGHPVIQIAFHETMGHYIRGLYNANLAYHMQHTGGTMIYNDMEWHNRHIYVLTGANRGGKTTFTQAIGQIYWLGMLGFFVPARSANLPMIDGMYVHFPIEEKETVLYGRLGEECQRFSTMFGRMTEKSLLLMNESFSGTSHSESLQIAREALTATAKIGVTGLFNTHLHELASGVEEMNQQVAEENFVFTNLVSGSQDDPQSFVIKEGEPLGKSYAHDIAVKYGISYEQLMNQ